MNLKIKLIPYEQLRERSLKSILSDLKKDTIILVDAKLDPEQEARLIEETMKRVSSKFIGIELNSLDIKGVDKSNNVLQKFKDRMVEFLTGKKRGLTIIGPASIIRKIEKNPGDLLLYLR